MRERFDWDAYFAEMDRWWHRLLETNGPEDTMAIKGCNCGRAKHTALSCGPELPKQRCLKPPRDWLCTREAGHCGPCAAVPLDELDAERAISLELLEAVKDALDRPDITTYEWYKLAPEHVGKFRRAIAKAEGAFKE